MSLAEAFEQSNLHEPTDLYRYYNAAGTLLYVGVSKSAIMRATQHERLAPWWDRWTTMTREVFASRDAALEAERAAIIAEKPVHNIVFRVASLHWGT